MTKHLISLAAVGAAGALVLAPGLARAAVFIELDPEATLTGSAAGSATDKNGGVNKPADDHAKEYNGPTQFKVDYTVNLKDGKFDPTGSTVTFTTVYYTVKGKKTKSVFKTLVIPIKTATLSKGSVDSFTFDTEDWYPNPAADGIKNNGIKGTVDLRHRKGNFTSSYTDASTGDIYTYKIGGGITFPKPGAPMPEPETWVLITVGFLAAGAGLRRAKRTISPCET